MSTTALPSLADTIVVVVLLIPGFIAFVLVKWISSIRAKFSEIETVIWSLFLSIITYIPFSLITGIDNLDAIRSKLLNPSYLSLIFSITYLVGFGAGGVLRCTVRRGMRPGNCWDTAVEQLANRGGGYVLATTRTGLEFKGILRYAGVEEDPRDIILQNPKLIIRGKNWKVKTEIEMGEQIFLDGRCVQSVAFL